LEFGVLVFVEEGKPENLEKKPSEQGENQQQTQPTYGIGLESNPGHTGGSECSRHYAIPAPLALKIFSGPVDFLVSIIFARVKITTVFQRLGVRLYTYSP